MGDSRTEGGSSGGTSATCVASCAHPCALHPPQTHTGHSSPGPTPHPLHTHTSCYFPPCITMHSWNICIAHCILSPGLGILSLLTQHHQLEESTAGKSTSHLCGQCQLCIVSLLRVVLVIYWPVTLPRYVWRTTGQLLYQDRGREVQLIPLPNSHSCITIVYGHHWMFCVVCSFHQTCNGCTSLARVSRLTCARAKVVALIKGVAPN